MKLSQVAAQLYTLREFVKTPADIARTLKKVREIGYEAVQLSSLGPIEESELLKILDGEGLVCCATHEPGAVILEKPQQVVERLQRLGCKHTAFPHPGAIDMSDVRQVSELARKLDAAGGILRSAGQTLSYHNHADEFARLGRKSALELIYETASAENLKAELDTYWVQYGGANPAEWCAKLQNRLPLLHLKDYSITKKNMPTMAEIGYGNLNWESIIPAAEKAGCEWFIVEQDVCPGDPIDSLKKSFEFIRDHLVS